MMIGSLGTSRVCVTSGFVKLVRYGVFKCLSVVLRLGENGEGTWGAASSEVGECRLRRHDSE